MKFKLLNREMALLAILALALLALYSLGRARLGQSIPDEKRYIQSTKEMVESGDYITPRYHGGLRFQKPILFYWFIILSYKIFGVGIFAARFPSILAAVLNVILIYLLGRELFGKRAGIFSALVLSTSEVYFMYSRFAAPDMVFILFITAAIYFFVKAYRADAGRRFKYLYMYACMGLAMLTKGPLGFIYPAITICFFLIFRKDWPAFKGLNFFFGLLVFAMISAPWFIAMAILHGSEYVDKVWSLEIAKKIKFSPSGSAVGVFAHYFHNMSYYAGMILARHLPWTLFLPASLISRYSHDTGPEKNKVGFTLINAWFFAVFMSLVLIWSKESYYVLGISMPLSLFLGVYFSKIAEERKLSESSLFRLPFIFAILACFLAFVGWLAFSVYILGKPILSLSLVMLTVPVIMLCAYFGKNKSLLPISFFIAVFAIFAYFAVYIVPALDQDPLSGITEEIKGAIKPGNVIGVASTAVSYHRLNVSFGDYNIIRVDKKAINMPQNGPLAGKRDFINDFLETGDIRVFCVITKKDYYKFVDEKLRSKLFVIDNAFIWKKFHKQKKGYLKKLAAYALKGKKEQLRQALKEEVYLVSNIGRHKGAALDYTD